MLWEVDISPKGPDAERQRVGAEYDLLTHHEDGLPPGTGLVLGATRGYLLEGDVPRDAARLLLDELLVDPLVESARLNELPGPARVEGTVWTVLLRPGVMGPAAQSVSLAARDLGVGLESARTFRRYLLDGAALAAAPRAAEYLRRVLANDAIEQITEGPLAPEHLALGRPYRFHLVTVPLRDLDDAGLERLSREGQLSLGLEEMRTIQAHFRGLGRDPTDAELETLAQTWSEHCSHKTLKGRIDFDGRHYDNLLKETIFAATQEIRRRLGPDDWCVSVFEDNAGVVRFDDRYNVCFKVETHNHPSAIEPYGGANTGLGGVIRDPLGTGLGARPVCNTDVFCFAPPPATRPAARCAAPAQGDDGRRGGGA